MRHGEKNLLTKFSIWNFNVTIYALYWNWMATTWAKKENWGQSSLTIVNTSLLCQKLLKKHANWHKISLFLCCPFIELRQIAELCFVALYMWESSNHDVSCRLRCQRSLLIKSKSVFLGSSHFNDLICLGGDLDGRSWRQPRQGGKIVKCGSCF